MCGGWAVLVMFALIVPIGCAPAATRCYVRYTVNPLLFVPVAEACGEVTARAAILCHDVDPQTKQTGPERHCGR